MSAISDKPITILSRFTSVTGIDKAVFLILLARLWSLLSSPITMVVTTSFLTRVEQGYYYTFNSILGAAVFLEFGLSTVLSQFASHEMAAVKWERFQIPVGESKSLSRLASILQLGTMWYTISAGIVLLGMIPLGQWYFLSNEQAEPVAWQIPWICVVVTSALNLALSPLLASLEGAGFVSQIAFYRLIQSIVGSLALWLCLFLHWSLFALPMMTGCMVLVAASFLIKDWRRPIAYLIKLPTRGHRVDYVGEVLPVHFQIALSWLSGYLSFYLCTPILFAQLGAVTAGQYGISLSLCLTMSALAQSWVSSRAPQMGMLIAARRFKELEILFRTNALRSMGIQIIGSCALMFCVFLLNAIESNYAGRLLDLPSFCFLCSAWVLGHGIAILSIYLRAYKRDPLCYQSLAMGVLFVVSCYFITPVFGINGAIAAQFVVQLAGLIGAYATYSWFRRAWQS